MKFVKLHSRGGNYLVVASNIAWLRTAENGQTSVGMVGGQPLLVVGSIEEVAETVLNATAEHEAPAPPAAPAPAVEVAAQVPQPIAQPPEPVVSPPSPEPEPEPVAAIPAPEPEPEPLAVEPEPEPESEPVAAATEPRPEPEPEPVPAPSARAASQAVARPRPAPRNSASLWERPVAPAAKGLKVKAGSQRMMGALD